jgi:ubiquinone/menaquinone biosynthesis C-methylase UbiE
MNGSRALDYKREAVKHWTRHPCASETSGEDFCTRSFFDELERHRYEVYAPWFKKLIPFSGYKGKRVLEVGVGMGTDHLQFAKGGALCYGIDLTPKSVEITKRRFEVYDYASRLSASDTECMPFAENSFDMVYSFGVLHHVPNIGKAADEIYRVLRPGGETWIGLYHRWSVFFLFQKLMKDGLLRGGLFRTSYRAFLSRIEEAPDQEPRRATVLVNVYSRRQVRKMFRRFTGLSIHTRHLTRNDLSPLARWAHRIPESVPRSLETSLGWYLILHACKPDRT